MEATSPLQQLQQPGDNQAWWVREGVECTAGAALWGREEEDGRRREGGEEESGLSPDLSSILETKGRSSYNGEIHG